jgi:biopolymer transport protein ExbB
MMIGGIGSYTYFHILFWPGGGAIGLVLWFLSIVMVALIVQVLINIRRGVLLPPGLAKRVQLCLDRQQYSEAIEVAARDDSYLGSLLSSALTQAPHGYAAMERAMEDTAEDRTVRLLRSVEYLNLMGNIGPMIGLLGTVWGMILAFFTIVAEGGIPSPEKLAEALGIKLVCTFVGLIVAIPSLTVYGLMRNRIDIITAEGLIAAQSIIGVFNKDKTDKTGQ